MEVDGEHYLNNAVSDLDKSVNRTQFTVTALKTTIEEIFLHVLRLEDHLFNCIHNYSEAKEYQPKYNKIIKEAEEILANTGYSQEITSQIPSLIDTCTKNLGTISNHLMDLSISTTNIDRDLKDIKQEVVHNIRPKLLELTTDQYGYSQLHQAKDNFKQSISLVQDMLSSLTSTTSTSDANAVRKTRSGTTNPTSSTTNKFVSEILHQMTMKGSVGKSKTKEPTTTASPIEIDDEEDNKEDDVQVVVPNNNKNNRFAALDSQIQQKNELYSDNDNDNDNDESYFNSNTPNQVDSSIMEKSMTTYHLDDTDTHNDHGRSQYHHSVSNGNDDHKQNKKRKHSKSNTKSSSKSKKPSKKQKQSQQSQPNNNINIASYYPTTATTEKPPSVKDTIDISGENDDNNSDNESVSSSSSSSSSHPIAPLIHNETRRAATAATLHAYDDHTYQDLIKNTDHTNTKTTTSTTNKQYQHQHHDINTHDVIRVTNANISPVFKNKRNHEQRHINHYDDHNDGDDEGHTNNSNKKKKPKLTEDIDSSSTDSSVASDIDSTYNNDGRNSVDSDDSVQPKHSIKMSTSSNTNRSNHAAATTTVADVDDGQEWIDADNDKMNNDKMNQGQSQRKGQGKGQDQKKSRSKKQSPSPATPPRQHTSKPQQQQQQSSPVNQRDYMIDNVSPEIELSRSGHSIKDRLDKSNKDNSNNTATNNDLRKQSSVVDLT